MRRRAQVALHHRRRRHLHVGDVVEARADRVGGQIFADVDVQSKERPNRSRVLRAIEPLEGATPRVAVRRGDGVESRLERGDECTARSRIGFPRSFLGWHQAGAQLADDLLRNVRTLGGLRDVKRGERQLTALHFVVVAADAERLDGVVRGR
jgi:hypothetical protein